MAELEQVREAGAPLMQGFLLGRPAPPWPAINRVALGERPVLAG